MKVINKYSETVAYVETWEPEPEPILYCPVCGVKGSLWTGSSVDEYVGCPSICISCQHFMNLLGGRRPINGPNELGIVKQLMQFDEGKE